MLFRSQSHDILPVRVSGFYGAALWWRDEIGELDVVVYFVGIMAAGTSLSWIPFSHLVSASTIKLPRDEDLLKEFDFDSRTATHPSYCSAIYATLLRTLVSAVQSSPRTSKAVERCKSNESLEREGLRLNRVARYFFFCRCRSIFHVVTAFAYYCTCGSDLIQSFPDAREI